MHDPVKERERCQKEDCLFLKWIEAPLGDAKHLDIFAHAEDTAIGMGGDRACQLFQDRSGLSEEQRLTKLRARRRRREEEEDMKIA